MPGKVAGKAPAKPSIDKKPMTTTGETTEAKAKVKKSGSQGGARAGAKSTPKKKAAPDGQNGKKKKARNESWSIYIYKGEKPQAVHSSAIHSIG